MGLMEAFASLFVTDAYAEEPPQESEDDSKESGGDEGGDEGKEDGEGDHEEGGDEEGGDEEGGDEEGGEEGGDDEEEEEEDEEEEEEPEDIMPRLQEECAKTAACVPHKHEYEECVERVKKWEESDDENKGKGEDCVEEYFEYVHCITQCAAPKLFKQLK